MKLYQDIFNKNIWWVILFLITFVLFIFSYWKNSVGLFFDIPAAFASVIFKFNENHINFLMINQNRARDFNDLLIAIPFNSIFYFIKNSSVINILRLWSSSYILIHFFGLIIMYLCARRTKRYDIAAIGFLFYSLFCIPNAIWAIREVHIAIPFYFSLLAYFLSYERLNVKDIIPVGLLCLYMFESFETTVILGLILFIFSNLYIKKYREDKNPWFKAIIGFLGLAAAIYIPVKTFYLGFKSAVNVSLGLSQWIDGSIITLKNLFNGNLNITWCAVICVIWVIFYKKKFGWKNYVGFFLLISFMLYFLYLKTGFLADSHIELHYYSVVLWFIYPVILLIILFDYFKVDVDNYNKYLFSNLVVIASIFGILNLLWQIHSFYEFGKYENYLKDLIKTKKEVVLNIPEEDFKNNSFLSYNNCFGVMQRAIFLTERGEKSKIIYPSKYFRDYSNYCVEDIDNTYYDKQNNILYIQTSPFKVKTPFWDLSDIVQVFEKENRVKN